MQNSTNRIALALSILENKNVDRLEISAKKPATFAKLILAPS